MGAAGTEGINIYTNLIRDLLNMTKGDGKIFKYGYGTSYIIKKCNKLG